MQHLVVLVREVPAAEAEKLREMAKTGEPHTWHTFYPYRDKFYNSGFAGGETAVIEADGSVMLHSLINVNDGALHIADGYLQVHPFSGEREFDGKEEKAPSPPETGGD